MATPSELLELFARFRGSSGIDRARAAGDALRAFASLSADDKRKVAVLVAEKAAPELVPRIREQTGVELSREQIQVVLEMVRNLDEEDVEDLRRVVADPAAREAALRSTAQATASAAVTAAGLDDDLPPPPPHLLDDEGPDGGTREAADELEAADAALADAERRRREIDEQAERELAEAQRELESLRAAEDAPEAAAAAVAPASTSAATSWDGSEEAAARQPGARAEPVTAEEIGEPAAPYEPVFELRDLPAREARAVAAATGSDLTERVRGAGSSGARLRVLTSSLDEVLALDSGQIAELVRAIPDGWARRRAVERLLEHDAILAEEVPDTLRLLGRASDRTWVAATAVEARLLDVDDLDGLIDARAAARLRRRYA